VATRPRIIVVDGPGDPADLARGLGDHETVRVGDLGAALQAVQDTAVWAVFIGTRDPELRSRADHLVQAEHILNTLPDGIAILDDRLHVLWANAAFHHWGNGDGARPLRDVLNSLGAGDPEHGPFAAARSGAVGTARMASARDRYVEVRVTLVPGSADGHARFVTQFRDVSDEELRQQKLDALHHAGRALINLDADQLADMEQAERVELLKHNLRQFIRDMLHYDVIEIRLLNRRTGELEPLLEEGMTPGAAHRKLFARPEDNGVTGYVAATGKSYLCPDTTHDPHYIEGAAGARSSLTVPLMVSDEVIGTFNVESPRPNAFTRQDLQFTEIFSREIAQALHTLELLTAEKRCTATASVDAISREVALQVDDILAATTALLSQGDGQAPEVANRLRQILARARSIKQSIVSVGETIAPAQGQAPETRLKGMRILVVDGDDLVRKSAHALIGRFGGEVETARSGAEALAMAQAGYYDAIMIDIRLPDLSGYDAYRRLREAQPRARMIMMTAFGYDASHSLVKARQDGLRCVLYKPFRADQLIDALTGTPAGTPQIART
jgi:CheY-like chemotaxis protein/putative methionine-R-sulfoxide reductase with GAF domain